MRISLETLQILAQMGDSPASTILCLLDGNAHCIAWARQKNPVGLEIRLPA